MSAPSRPLRLLASAALLAALAPGTARAERAAGLTSANGLVTFDTAAPGGGTVRPITGLQTADERVVAIDTRPATGELWAISVAIGSAANAPVHSYRVNAATGAATYAGSSIGIPGTGDRRTGADFTPLFDRLRVVQDNNENFRLNPNTAAIAGDDVNLTYSAPATGPVVALAYDRNVAPGPPGTVAPPDARTTLFGIDAGSSRLVVQGGIDGATAGGANGGTITAIGPLGVTLASGADAGLDISPSGTAYAALTPSAGTSGLYTVDLGTGAATLAGALPVALSSLAILPPDNCPGVDGDDQADLDGDGLGDACDPDIDGDGISNDAEQAMGGNPRSTDGDGDGVADGADACPALAAATPNGCPAATPPSDRTAPSVAIRRLAARMTYARFLRGVTLRVRPSEPSAFRIELIGTVRRATVSRAGDLVLATRALARAGGERAVRLRPARRLLGRSRRFRVTVRITGTDAAGNRRVISRRVRVTG